MTDNEKDFENFVHDIKFDDIPDHTHRDNLEHDLRTALTGQTRHKDKSLGIRRIIMKSRITRFAAAAVIAIVVISGISFWPGGSENGKWWLESPAAWGQEIIASLEKVEALVYRQRVAWDGDYAPQRMSTGWERRYNAKDRYRRDRYDDGKNVMNIQWVMPDGEDILMLEVSVEYECYFERRNEAYGFMPDLMEKMRWYVGLLDKADRVFDTMVFEGRECVGFEVASGKYGDNPDGRFDRIWFDVETKLPVRIEKHGLPLSSGFDPSRTITIIHDQFEYHAEVPLDMFEPHIPKEFINAHPDEVRAIRDKEQKGVMVYADVSTELTAEIIAALKEVKTARYHEGASRIYLSKNAWRKDYYSAERLLRIDWYVSEQLNVPATGFEPDNKRRVLTQVDLDLKSKTCKFVTHTADSQPRHPMSDILFVAGLVGRADQVLENEEIEGIECFGFEISAKKYGDNPDHMKHRIWFDSETKLPVRMEFERLQDDDTEKRVRVRDRFEWNPELPAETFVPEIPEGYMLIDRSEADDLPGNAH